MTETITGLGLPYMGSKRKLAKKIVDKILADNPTCHNDNRKTRSKKLNW